MPNKIIEMTKKDISQICEEAEDVYPSDIDRLQILSDVVSDEIPFKFRDVLKNLEATHASSPGPENIQMAERLLTILKTHEDVVNFQSTQKNSSLIPLFEIGQQDRERIEKLCEQMRKVVFSTTDFDEPHRLRLLNRIAAIEAEVHKPQGMFDVVRGGVDDLGETLGKFGKDIKPLTDRMREVVRITRKGTKEYDQLPGPEEVKQLPTPYEEDERE